MSLIKAAISTVAFVSLVSGHARITSPKTRGVSAHGYCTETFKRINHEYLQPGPLAEQYCGAGNAYKNLKNGSYWLTELSSS